MFRDINTEGKSGTGKFTWKSVRQYERKLYETPDNLCHPVSVIKRRQNSLLRSIWRGRRISYGWGTTSSVQTMILTCKKGDEDYFAQKRTQKRDQRSSCTVRATRSVKIRMWTTKRYFAGNEAGTGEKPFRKILMQWLCL